MVDSPAEDALVLPPIPLATGSVLEPEDDGDPVRITKLASQPTIPPTINQMMKLITTP